MEQETGNEKKKIKAKQGSPKKKKTKNVRINSENNTNKKIEKLIKQRSTLVDDVMFKDLELSNDIKIILIKEAFRMFDADESGYIDKREFRKLIQSLGLEMNIAKIDELMKNVDKDGSGSIDIEEFTAMMIKYQFNKDVPISTHLDSAFNLYDKDEDGIISEEDLLKVALELDEDIKQDEALIIINLAKTLMSELDNVVQNENDIVGISKKEFVNLLLKTKFLTDLNNNQDNIALKIGNEQFTAGENYHKYDNKNSKQLNKQQSNTSFKNTSKESSSNKNIENNEPKSERSNKSDT